MEKSNKDNKNYWDENPMTYKPFEDEFSERILDSQDDYRFLNKFYLEENFYLKSYFRNLNNLNILKDLNVLDIGCGWGSSTFHLSKFSEKVTSIDISPVAIEGAKKNISLNGIKNTQILEMDAEKLDFNDNTFDYLFSWGVIHHSSRPEKIYNEIYRVLKSGSKGSIMVYNKSSLRYWLMGIYHLYFRGMIFKGYDWSNVTKKFTDGYYHKHYVPKRLKEEFLSIGFSNVDIVISHYLGKGKILPFIKTNSYLGKFLSQKFGYFLTIEFTK
tara:strand:- start:389 stop:1201 length:813 start_codon:yes stop_codon:yes gene_type:complete